MEALTVCKTLKTPTLTLNLMTNNYVHINNHKTNSDSVIVKLSDLKKLIGE